MDHLSNQQQPKLPTGSPNKDYVMLPLRKLNDSPNHQLIQIQHSNLDNYCRKWFTHKQTNVNVISGLPLDLISSSFILLAFFFVANFLTQING